jgi:hypothetical protein
MEDPTHSDWIRPELIVIVRSGPEEAVLQACKGGGQDGVNASTDACMGSLAPCLDVAAS